jgi:hypothetical protein
MRFGRNGPDRSGVIPHNKTGTSEKYAENEPQVTAFPIWYAFCIRAFFGRCEESISDSHVIGKRSRARSRGGLVMGTSAFEILIMPVVLGTLGSVALGAAILGAMKTIEALAGGLGRKVRSMKMVSRTARRRVPRTDRAFVGRVKSIG